MFFGDPWSFRLLVSLLNRGYQVICGVVASAFDATARSLYPVFRDEGLFEGVYWVTLDLDDAMQLQRDVTAITSRLHCIVPCYPASRAVDEKTSAVMFKFARVPFLDTAALKEGIMGGALFCGRDAQPLPA